MGEYMKKSLALWTLAGATFTAVLGTVLHFLYGWADSAAVAPFSGVNESTWEHMKLLFWPMLLFAVVQRFFFSKREDFWCVKLRGILLGLLLIPLLFYTYNGVIGHSPDWINITIFFVSAALAYLYEARQFSRGTVCRHPRFALFCLLVVAFSFVLFTYQAPSLGIFRDPLTGTYGI